MNRNYNRCAQCRFYDGEICTKDLNNLNYDYVIDTMYKAPFDTCEDFEEDFDREGDEDDEV